VISGRVFAIIGNGDLKPARFAEVNLFYMNPDLGESEEPNAAANFWIRERKKAADKWYAEMKRRMSAFVPGKDSPAILPSERERCIGLLDTYYVASVNATHWIVEKKLTDQSDYVQADEEGAFRFRLSRAGMYLVVATGRAGFNEAVWTDYVYVSLGEEAMAKLSSPSASCLAVQ